MIVKKQEPIQISKEKHEELKKELMSRKSDIRKQISVRLIAAKDLGDLKENAEYHTARDDQGKNESRVKEIEEVLRIAEIISKPQPGGEVSLGSVVSIQKKGATMQQKYTVVGPQEADMAAGKISSQSPIGAALMGQKKDTQVTIISPGGSMEYTIISVA